MIAPFISQWLSCNILNLNIWIIRCLIVCPVLLFFIWFLNIIDFVLQITRSKMLIKTSVRAETLVTFGTYMRTSICICTSVRWPVGSSIWHNTSVQSLQLILIVITINLLQMIVDIGKYYSNHFTVAEIASTIFNGALELFRFLTITTKKWVLWRPELIRVLVLFDWALLRQINLC